MTTKDKAPRTTPERAGGRLVLVMVMVLALLVGGGWAAAYYGAGENVPRGTSVAGIEIGGRTRAAAESALRGGLSDRLATPVPLSIDGGEPVEVDPVDAGIRVDYDATVAEAGGGRSWSPDRLWSYYTGGDDVDLVVDVDEDALGAVVADLQAGLGSGARDGAVRFRGGRAVVQQPRTGAGLDVDAVGDALVQAFLDGEPAEVSSAQTQPSIDADDVQDALDDFANPALSESVDLVFGGDPVRLLPRQYVGALGLEPQDGVLVPTVDAGRLAKLVRGATKGGKDAPVDARFRVVDGKPEVVRAKPGVTYDRDDIAAAFLQVVIRPSGKRSIDVEATVDQPAFTTRDARKLKIKEQVSEFSTTFPYAEYRNVNIGRAAEIVDGTVLEPGDVFSLNKIVGERTRQNGFTDGFIISNGIFKEDLGGGVSQMATTTFNAMFFAGLEDVEHKPHSFYIDRYPVGREATVAFGSIDLRFRNDTDYGVLIESKVTPATPSSQGVVRVAMYSTKVWDIDSRTSDRYAATAPATRVLRTADCYPNSGYSGFQIDVTRIFRKAGESKVDHKEKFHTVYTPSDSVVCKPPLKNRP